MVSAASPQQEALYNISVVCGALLCAGILYQRLFGVEMGGALVGLQRLPPGSERADLPVGRGVLWPGRYGAELLSYAPVHETVSQNFPQVAPDPVRCFPGSVSAGHHLLRGQTKYGVRDFGIRGKKYAKNLPNLNLPEAIL